MIPAQRRQMILKVLEDQGVISISELVERLDVSHMTVRRDLQNLEKEGLVVTVTGGVQLTRRLTTEPSHQIKETLCAEEKARIGKEACKYISDNSCIYLDAGTTSLALAQNLDAFNNLTIASNDFEVINYLLPHTRHTLIHAGGVVQKENRSSVGHLAANTLLSLSFDVAFLSAPSFDIRGVTTPDQNKVVVKQAAVKSSQKRILISDSSKYGHVATYLAVKTEDLDLIITDTGLSEVALENFQKASVNVVTV